MFDCLSLCYGLSLVLAFYFILPSFWVKRDLLFFSCYLGGFSGGSTFVNLHLYGQVGRSSLDLGVMYSFVYHLELFYSPPGTKWDGFIFLLSFAGGNLADYIQVASGCGIFSLIGISI